MRSFIPTKKEEIMYFFVFRGLRVDTNTHLFLKERSAPVGEPHSLTEGILHIRMPFQYPT